MRGSRRRFTTFWEIQLGTHSGPMPSGIRLVLHHVVTLFFFLIRKQIAGF